MEAATSNIKPEKREFVVDSGASMHMVSKKDFDGAELENEDIQKYPTTVVRTNGEVLGKEKATVYVCVLDIFVTVMLLEMHRQFFHSENSSNNLGTVIIKEARELIATFSNYVPFVVLGLSQSSSTLSTSPAGN